MKGNLWKVRLQLPDGGFTTVTVAARDKTEAEGRAHLKARALLGVVTLKLEAVWQFSPPKRWYQRRAGSSMRNALGALCCQAWLAAVPWAVEMLQTHPRTAVLVIGVGFTAVFFGLLRVLVRLTGEADGPEMGDGRWEMGTKTARLEPPAGSMTEEHREALLRHLLRASEGMGKPMMADEVRAAGSLTVPQLGAFMGWAHGQVLVHEGESFACVLERGVQARWLRFRCVQRRAAGKAFTRRAGA